MILRGLLLIALLIPSYSSASDCDEQRYEELKQIPIKSMTDAQYAEYDKIRADCVGLDTRSYEPGASPSVYELKIAKFRGMKIGGLVLMGGGAVALASGIAMMASSGTSSYQVSYNSDGTKTESGDPVGGFGAVIMIIGIPMTVGGAILTIIGSSKQKEYKEKLRELSLQLDVNGISLSYSF